MLKKYDANYYSIFGPEVNHLEYTSLEIIVHSSGFLIVKVDQPHRTIPVFKI